MPDNPLMISLGQSLPPLSRRGLLKASAALVMAGSALRVMAKDSHLPRPKSLALEARRANAAGEPLVLMVSLPGCPYCELVRRNYLRPMREQDGLAAWQIDIRDKAPITGFDTQVTSPLALIRAWGVKVTPTVFFFDTQGRELAPRLEGVAVVDFYGSYLEDRLKQSRDALAAAPPKTGS